MDSQYFTLYFQNVHGLNTKINDFVMEVNCNNYDVIAICESWFRKDRTYFTQLSKNYNVFRNDRITQNSTKAKGGGCCLLVKKKFQFKEIDIPFKKVEALIGYLTAPGFHTTLLALHYFPPDFNHNQFQDYCTWFIATFINKNVRIVFLGDLNVPGIDWATGNISTNHFYIKKKAEALIELSLVLNLTQLNDSYVQNNRTKVLDVLLTNIQSGEISTKVYPLIKSESYHPPFVYMLKPSVTHLGDRFVNKKASKLEYCFHQANFDNIVQDFITLSKNLRGQKCMNIQGHIHSLYSHIDNSFDKNIPKKVKSNEHSKEYRDPWMTKTLKRLINKKSRYFIKYKKTGDQFWYTNYSLLRKEVKKQYREARNNYFKELENSLICNPRYFWAHYNKSKRNKGVTSIIVNDRSTSDCTVIAETFKDYFLENFTMNSDSNSNTYNNEPYSNLIGIPSISSNDVIKAIQKLKPRSSVGSDNVPNYIIKACGSYLAPVLAEIFNKSLQLGQYPEAWKKAIIVPVHKGGNKLSIENYRPISVLNGFARVFESIVEEHLKFNLKHIFHDNQHGFLPGKSIVTNLSQATYYIQGCISRKEQCDVIYFDLSKAFDMVNHSTLLTKLSRIGLSPIYIKWFTSYLDNRTFQVKFSKTYSTVGIIKNGIPQGSPLGPLLFNIFINDLCTTVSHSIPVLYADDLKLLGKIESNTDIQNIQKDIKMVEKWCENNKMKINTTKTNLISYTRKTNPTVSQYTLMSQSIEKVHTVKDLGVTFDEKLNFQVHLNIITMECKRLIGFIFNQWCEIIRVHTYVIMYKVLVRTKLEYAVNIWSTKLKTCTEKVEAIQKFFIRLLCYKCKLPYHKYSYNEWCDYLQLKPLYIRKKEIESQIIDGIFSNKIQSTYLLDNLTIQVPKYFSRNHNFLNTKEKNNSFLKRMVDSYNELNNVTSHS